MRKLRDLAIAPMAITASLLVTACAGNPTYGQTPTLQSPVQTSRQAARGTVDPIIIAPWARVTSFEKTLRTASNTVTRAGSLFSSDVANNIIDKFAVTNIPGGSPSTYYSGLNAPQGIAFANRQLFVANTGTSSILVVRAGKRVRTLDDPGEFPANVALGSDGTVYAANVFTTSNNAGNIVIYSVGSRNPTSTLTASSFYQVIGVAVDSSGDIFASNNTSFFSGGQVIEFPHGKTTGKVLNNVITSVAGGLAINPKTQDLLVVDQGTQGSMVHGVVRSYAPPYNGSAIFARNIPNGGSAVDAAIGGDGLKLYVTDGLLDIIDVFDYPGGLYRGSYGSSGQPIGVVATK